MISARIYSRASVSLIASIEVMVPPLVGWVLLSAPTHGLTIWLERGLLWALVWQERVRIRTQRLFFDDLIDVGERCDGPGARFVPLTPEQ
jgi:hypothetical protein